MEFTSISVEDKNYPALLKEIPGAPAKIYIRGTLHKPGLPTVAIVGTRKATKDGRELAAATAKKLAKAGVVVVSGLAMGVDTAAHVGTLNGNGVTIAVLGNGIDSVYPAQNQKLAQKIIKNGGGIISEYGLDEPSYKGRFIERNRIISGLSLGVVVIEAPERSGALTTARFAAEQGRDVFVFPGPAKSPHYAGSHALIRDGATLVTKTSDILEDIGVTASLDSSTATKNLKPDEYAVVQAISGAGRPLSVDMIIELTTLEPHMVSQVVATLTIDDIIKEGELGYEISNS